MPEDPFSAHKIREGSKWQDARNEIQQTLHKREHLNALWPKFWSSNRKFDIIWRFYFSFFRQMKLMPGRQSPHEARNVQKACRVKTTKKNFFFQKKFLFCFMTLQIYFHPRARIHFISRRRFGLTTRLFFHMTFGNSEAQKSSTNYIWLSTKSISTLYPDKNKLFWYSKKSGGKNSLFISSLRNTWNFSSVASRRHGNSKTLFFREVFTSSSQSSHKVFCKEETWPETWTSNTPRREQRKGLSMRILEKTFCVWSENVYLKNWKLLLAVNIFAHRFLVESISRVRKKLPQPPHSIELNVMKLRQVFSIYTLLMLMHVLDTKSFIHENCLLRLLLFIWIPIHERWGEVRHSLLLYYVTNNCGKSCQSGWSR